MLQDGLIYLCFKSGRFVSRRTKGSEQPTRCRKVANSLGDSGLLHDSIHIIRRDIEHLIKLFNRLGKTTKNDVGNRVLVEQIDITRVEALCFLEMRLALVPPTSPTSDISEQLRNSAAIRQELACLLKITHSGIVI